HRIRDDPRPAEAPASRLGRRGSCRPSRMSSGACGSRCWASRSMLGLVCIYLMGQHTLHSTLARKSYSDGTGGAPGVALQRDRMYPSCAFLLAGLWLHRFVCEV